jgi:hypothetical protein
MTDVYTCAKNMPENWPEHIIERMDNYDAGIELYSDTIRNSTEACMNAFIAWCRNRHSDIIEIPDYNIEDFLSAVKIVYYRRVVFYNDETLETSNLFDIASQLSENFCRMVQLFRQDVLAHIHDEGITLAEQISILSSPPNERKETEIFECYGGKLEELLREYLLKFFPWREKNKTQIMKKNMRDTNYKFLKMIAINGDKKLDYSNPQVHALQLEINILRIQINDYMRTRPDHFHNFTRFLDYYDQVSAICLANIDLCILYTDKINEAELQIQENVRKNNSRQIINFKKYTLLKEKSEAELIDSRLKLEKTKKGLKYMADVWLMP